MRVFRMCSKQFMTYCSSPIVMRPNIPNSHVFIRVSFNLFNCIIDNENKPTLLLNSSVFLGACEFVDVALRSSLAIEQYSRRSPVTREPRGNLKNQLSMALK